MRRGRKIRKVVKITVPAEVSQNNQSNISKGVSISKITSTFDAFFHGTTTYNEHAEILRVQEILRYSQKTAALKRMAFHELNDYSND